MDDRSDGRSLWMTTTSAPPRPAVSGEQEYDVAVVGAGITGLTTAVLAKRAGMRVAVLEMGEVGQGVTGFTTAKITSLHQLVYAELVQRHNEATARVYGAANEAAIAQIAELVDTYDIGCAFERREAVTWTTAEDMADRVRREGEVARRLGLPVRVTTTVDLPFAVRAAVVFDDQAQFHPRAYLLGLADVIDGDGSAVFQHSRVVRLRPGTPVRLTVADRTPGERGSGGTIVARDVVLATGLPFFDVGGFFARAHPKRSYLLSATAEGPVPESMSISAGSEVRSLRVYDGDGRRRLLVGGEGHRPGASPDERVHWDRLERWAREHFALGPVDHRWSAQDYTSVDGMPYAGRLMPLSRHLWTATGYRKWGMTNGTAAAMIIAAELAGQRHPWTPAFDAQRLTVAASARSFLEENARAAWHFAADRVRLPGRAAVDDLADGDGAVVRVDGRALAVSRQGDRIRAVSPVCTHLGCHVAWNRAEQSWDCPCHGSRFDPDGTVIQGPATRDLKPRALREE
ncbi:MAG TPA: FAD-dependent oxidoreductase [Euzebyales bacterium]|nr:FAD-dependent oxidoreductase [Euzebyales bacterium]